MPVRDARVIPVLLLVWSLPLWARGAVTFPTGRASAVPPSTADVTALPPSSASVTATATMTARRTATPSATPTPQPDRPIPIPPPAHVIIARSPVTVTVRIPEGWRAEQVAALLELAGVARASDIVRAVRQSNSTLPIADGRPMGQQGVEGFLYPDTYNFYRGRSALYYYAHHPAASAVKTMLHAFIERISPTLIDRGRLLYGSFYRAVIVASLVEREAGTEKDRGLISSVIRNRRRDRSGRFRYLNLDSTVPYALGRAPAWWPRVRQPVSPCPHPITPTAIPVYPRRPLPSRHWLACALR